MDESDVLASQRGHDGPRFPKARMEDNDTRHGGHVIVDEAGPGRPRLFEDPAMLTRIAEDRHPLRGLEIVFHVERDDAAVSHPRPQCSRPAPARYRVTGPPAQS